MDRLLKKPGYTLHPPGSPEAEALLSERGLTRADLDRALAELARTEGIQVRTIVGINDDGVFGSRQEGWHPDLPRCLRRALRPDAVDPGAGVARACTSGQHGKVREDGTLPD